jgi:hypothetical protein
VKHFSPKNLLTVTLVCGWLLAAGFGIWRLTAYSFTPGEQGVPPSHWPEGTALQRNSQGFTAVVALHPECPCSEATLEELDSIVAQSAGRLQARVLFEELPGLPPVEESPRWKQALRITHVVVAKDPNGREAHRFGARTSGETRLYGPDGNLLFHGGITGSRGHAGDNPGQAAVLGLITHPAPVAAPLTAPVFGCSL